MTTRSYVMIDKSMTPLRSRVGQIIGQVGSATMHAVDRALVLFLGLV